MGETTLASYMAEKNREKLIEKYSSSGQALIPTKPREFREFFLIADQLSNDEKIDIALTYIIVCAIVGFLACLALVPFIWLYLILHTF